MITLYELSEITKNIKDEKKKEKVFNHYWKWYCKWFDRELMLAKQKWKEEEERGLNKCEKN